MTRSLFLLLLLGISTAPASAQELTRYFEIVPHKSRFCDISPVPNSLYHSIDFMDSRSDSALIGLVGVGLLKNRDANLVFRTPILPQLKRLMDTLTDPSAKGAELLFQLRDFNFSETFGARYFYIRASLYVRRDSGYTPLANLDTLAILVDADLVRTANLAGNVLLTNFLRQSLRRETDNNTLLSLTDIANIDSIDRRPLPLYNTTTFTDGVYLSYSSFARQLPDRQAMVEQKKDGSISSVRVLDEQAKKVRLKSKEVYAVVNNGRLFIATEYGFYPLQKIRDNFFFTGDVRIVATQGDISAGQFAFGLIGAISASKGSKERYDLILDPLNGNFIHLRYIPMVDTPQ